MVEFVHLVVIDGQDGSTVAHLTTRVPLLLPAYRFCYGHRLSSQGEGGAYIGMVFVLGAA